MVCNFLGCTRLQYFIFTAEKGEKEAAAMMAVGLYAMGRGIGDAIGKGVGCEMQTCFKIRYNETATNKQTGTIGKIVTPEGGGSIFEVSL